MTRCACCGRMVQLTVDDTGLCVRCDLLLYPFDYAAAAGL